MRLVFSPKKLLTVFLVVILFLLVANVVGLISRFYFDHDHVFGLVRLFDFRAEKNIPTLYSSIALMFASVLLVIITLMHRSSQQTFRLWGLLAFIFLFLSIDEASSIHEQFSGPTKSVVATSGLFYYAWVIPYGVALMFFLIGYLKFLRELPGKTRVLFLVSGFIFVSGAVGFEMLGGWRAETEGSKGLLYAIFYTCEELLEMLGVAIFIYALSEYIVSQWEYLEITLAGD
ncbi:hypothetical protein HBA55_26040 [Pseudomaricurvus alkylphenolicus]|uniref:hypothetical protein n=1 Tax=Pseudomaricurvus alkylphenolicus TaxID=1306991 RepID=UPI0014235B82|nr:hypothetical protein [Pseudomaricurvus alkylphenolicus]NIB43097.1 hypothetical protein [Pseudomaricurvus alkylphenolicus]